VAGFGQAREAEEKTRGMLLAQSEFDDLLKYGIIPELVGRLPVLCALDDLDEEALLKILTEPKNALVRQYEKSFEMDGVQLEFEEEAFQAVVQMAIKKGTGARALRSILEAVMLELMFQIPGQETVNRIVVTEEMIRNLTDAHLQAIGLRIDEDADVEEPVAAEAMPEVEESDQAEEATPGAEAA